LASGSGIAPLALGGKAALGGLPVPPFASGSDLGGPGELDPTPAPERSAVGGDSFDFDFDFFSRGGGEIGNASPATPTSTSAVTQTGVWSLEAEYRK
jgi:hypothetical protein